MADVELVIRIPQEMYAEIIDEDGIDTMLVPYKDIVKNGTPLPKGHGRMIDADALYDQFEYADYDFEKTLEYAPTIIEADTESEGAE